MIDLLSPVEIDFTVKNRLIKIFIKSFIQDYLNGIHIMCIYPFIIKINSRI